MVPGTFTFDEITRMREFLIDRIKRFGRIRNGKVSGIQMYITYGECMRHFGYDIENEHDGDRAGILVGEASKLEHEFFAGPLISVIVINHEQQRPGNGFYKLGIELKLLNVLPENLDFTGRLENDFLNQQQIACIKKYGIIS
jgi:hypothetical protein